ncbi:nitrate reductase subunit beta [Cellulosimicrobium sp. Marseille-Q4280]|uniref:nitrate reductase subunit beta n=1 Tax=Cellulosimicrobium sp. Marseille-Q4280 TaxID=2937992 RepID=UPI002557DC4C|nr:nitrate reductase subunit beta [Cellulosimicrobium sp. Marseille-Q4280]
MRVMAQMSMVMNLDKCIGCHTCSVTCKQAWTNRTGVEYVWFNNVETRPGLGYPRTYQDQERWEGGWVRTRSGKLKLRAGGRLKKLATIFSNPKLPSIHDYYEPWTYEYDMLLSAPQGKHTPVARPKSLLTGENMQISWSANWDDDLGGSTATMQQDPVLQHMSEHVAEELEKTFMFYLPRICEHCLNPACVASCPSGAMYKRAEDGIVLVDQDQCRGWRMCVTGCPYKKVYFNHKTGKAEKCTLCYPRLEVGLPTVCSETCVGRLRYLGLVLYDADRVSTAAAAEDEHDLLAAQRSILLDPHDPEVVAAARREGIPDDWITAAQASPIWKLISEYEVALPLHPEYRTLPMVWYIPPLSPVVDTVTASGNDGEDGRTLFAAISQLRIPLEYLAGLFTAGDTAPVEKVLRRLAAMRSSMREVNLGNAFPEENATAVGMTGREVQEMYRLLAIAKYEERYVIPTAHTEIARELDEMACSLDVDGGPGMGGYGGTTMGGGGPFGSSSGQPMPVAVENFHVLQARQTADSPHEPSTTSRVNLLNWDGRGRPAGLFPPEMETGHAAAVGQGGGTPPGAPGTLPGGRQDARHDAPGGVESSGEPPSPGPPDTTGGVR